MRKFASERASRACVGVVCCAAYASQVCAYGGRLAEVDSLCLQSGFVVCHSLAIEAMAG